MSSAGPVSKVFLIIILLAGHLSNVDIDCNRFEVVEYYAGAARLAKISRGLNGESAAMDILYDREGDNKTKNNLVDINTSAGFLPLTCRMMFSFFFMFRLLPASKSRMGHLMAICQHCLPQVGMHSGSTVQDRRVPGSFWDLLLNICWH